MFSINSRKSHRPNTSPKQAGFTLLEVVLAMGLVAIASLLTMEANRAENDQNQARLAGNILAQYNNGVRSYVSQNLGANGIYSGTDWLKSTSCGGLSSIEYLPCNFPSLSTAVPFSRGGLSVQTQIISVPKGFSFETRATSSVTAYKLDTKTRADLAGVIAIVVASSKPTQADALNSDGKVNADPKTGVITLEASNVATNDPWLRVDGGNMMSGSLKMGNVSPLLRNVVGASALESFAGELLYLGPASGLSSSLTSGVVIDSDATILGELQARDQIIADASINILTGNLDQGSGSITAKALQSVDNSTLLFDPDKTSSTKSADVVSKLIVKDSLMPGQQSKTTCQTPGAISSDATGRIMTCRGADWERVTKSPKVYRFTFTADGTWTVPEGVTSAYISIAGGGSSGVGWRSSNYTATGHSGGFVMNHPMNLEPGEVLQITVGAGGRGSGPIRTGILADPGPPYYIYYNPDSTTTDGLSGYPGGSSIVTSLTRGLLIECSGGSGVSMNGYNSMLGSAVTPTASIGNPIEPVLKDYAPGVYATPSRMATGSYAKENGPGACGPADYGRGNSGTAIYEVSSGIKLGGLSPLAYGSGGDIGASGCYVTHDFIGSCVYVNKGKPGIVYIDVLY
jgi:prepilin-type N-terminal cleavage/methylation domain-containing protein